MKTLCIGGPHNGCYADQQLPFYQVAVYFRYDTFGEFPKDPIPITPKTFTYKLTDIRIPYFQNGRRFYYIPESWSNSDLFDYFERAVIAYEDQNT